MKRALTKQLLLTTAILLAGTACTNENTEGLPGNPSSPSDGDAATRREVVVTIKNKLTVTPAGTKAGEIATAEENKISSLDIYVFGSAAEDGDYTFQERFAYREKPDDTPVPAGATSIDLTQTGDGKEASVSMKLQKGLFVKLYAIANQPALVDPNGIVGTGSITGGTLMLDSDFQPLVLTNPGQQGTTVKTVGIPTEAEFLTLHNPLLEATTLTDILATPLPMSGANTVPTDLTDFEAFARIQASFKLTRTVARFDVVNDATTSRFTITDISMGNARKGAAFFPIVPVSPEHLITMPKRTFTGMTNANAGTTPAAFYSYPSPKEDKGYIILTGTYKMNNTDPEKTVSYQIPFEQEVNGSGSYIEVAPNHRYTIAITKADDYHLDFNLTVADWTDEGNVDGFEPTEPALPAPEPTPRILTINQSVLTSFKAVGFDLTEYPPFDADGEKKHHGCNVNEEAGTMIGSYTIEVQEGQSRNDGKYDDHKQYCTDLEENGNKGWRLPTLIEGHAIYTNKKEIEDSGAGIFNLSYHYWSSSISNGDIGVHCTFHMSANRFGKGYGNAQIFVRCVRDITP